MSVSTSTSVDIILGAVVLTGILGALFFGAACIQTYNYYQTYQSDTAIIRGAVAALWVVDALHIGVYTYTIWYYVVIAFDTAWVPQIMDWLLSTWLSVVTLSSRSYVLPVIVGLTVAAGSTSYFPRFTDIYDISSSALIYLFFGLFCVKATCIAMAMIWCLLKSNDKFSKESNTPVRRAIKLVVGSGLLLAYHLAMPHSMACVVSYMIISKLYHNSFLSLLACRSPPLGLFDGSEDGAPLKA
ncbi:hypothetical protein C8J57DRAFT_1298472 [Mycena rebaudengoi]|nr:hypothetical protein C8J57DRAFT_1298472 [Mycena rebaudengoi]